MVIIASILIGIVMGLLGALLTKYTEQVHGECVQYIVSIPLIQLCLIDEMLILIHAPVVKIVIFKQQ